MTLSDQGRAFIIAYEKKEPRVYRDSAGKNTIGIGHLITPEELRTGTIWIQGVACKWRTATMSDCFMEALFQQDLAPRIHALNNLLERTPKQHEYDAMFSLLFNIGIGSPDKSKPGGFWRSSVRRHFNEGRTEAAGNAFLLWNKETRDGKRVVSNGLVKRRKQEKDMFLNGVYNSKH